MLRWLKSTLIFIAHLVRQARDLDDAAHRIGICRGGLASLLAIAEHVVGALVVGAARHGGIRR